MGPRGLVVVPRAEVLVGGRAAGEVLRLDAPIGFWGGVAPATSEVILAGHPQRGERLAGRVVVVPRAVGSSSSAAVILELLYRDRAPAALILGARDAILPVGVLAARQMGWRSIPVLAMAEPPFRSGDRVRIREDGRILALDPGPAATGGADPSPRQRDRPGGCPRR